MFPMKRVTETISDNQINCWQQTLFFVSDFSFLLIHLYIPLFFSTYISLRTQIRIEKSHQVNPVHVKWFPGLTVIS